MILETRFYQLRLADVLIPVVNMKIATIGFYGGGGRVGKDMYPNYQMSLGGRFDGDTMLGQTCIRVPAKRVIPVILKIIELFKENKKIYMIL